VSGAAGTRGGVLPRLLVVGGAAFWGTTGTTQALAPPHATSASVGSVRLVLGALALAAIAAALRGLGDLRGYSRRGQGGAALCGMVAMAAYQVCFFAGVARAGVAAGVDGIFIEAHPNPPEALCDAASQYYLDQLADFVRPLLDIHNLVRAQAAH
jgi:hypothetical protein